MKLYTLWKLALDDLRVVERDPKFKINMSMWHYVMPNGNCTGCMAGAMIYLGHLPDILCREASAVNFLRQGLISAAHMELYGEWMLFDRMPCLAYGTASFWDDAEKLLSHLKELKI